MSLRTKAGRLAARMTNEQIIAVDCVRCGAKAGTACKGPRGAALSKFHGLRIMQSSSRKSRTCGCGQPSAFDGRYGGWCGSCIQSGRGPSPGGNEDLATFEKWMREWCAETATKGREPADARWLHMQVVELCTMLQIYRRELKRVNEAAA